MTMVLNVINKYKHYKNAVLYSSHGDRKHIVECKCLKGTASNKESRESSAKSQATHACYEEITCNRHMNRIHYPMTYSNYPFNAIRAIVKLSSATSRTFPATLTQKHQLKESQ